MMMMVMVVVVVVVVIRGCRCVGDGFCFSVS
jgi:hypothetical protein